MLWRRRQTKVWSSNPALNIPAQRLYYFETYHMKLNKENNYYIIEHSSWDFTIEADTVPAEGLPLRGGGRVLL